MAKIEALGLAWKGRNYEIPGNRLMHCIAKIEDVLPLVALARCYTTRDLPMARVAQAYGILLREAGARVSDREIFDDLRRAVLDVRRRNATSRRRRKGATR